MCPEKRQLFRQVTRAEQPVVRLNKRHCCIQKDDRSNMVLADYLCNTNSSTNTKAGAHTTHYGTSEVPGTGFFTLIKGSFVEMEKKKTERMFILMSSP